MFFNAACFSEWSLFEGSCYILIKTTKNWDNAKSACETLDGHLVKIEALAENNFVLQLVQTKGPELNDGIWHGLRFRSGAYKWTDGTVAVFTRWNTGEPNNGSGAPCGQMYIKGALAGKWNDDYTSTLLPFVCEKAER